ncbi:DUF3618 domain-containing protein [Agrococcus sp. SGAir0287]|uniref:DUF3618 domain-containing protein n=1 Tax=Agrococcus sp. SGAir0287 TaxID=2070347 RepID=UPI0010CCD5DD|nr:DUF3618 domain-containing protein [Agrococcus sp. SGAir0287]QCR18244.1 hypothetical protein C1N71_01255 [Agrococcus sp. SGAir0287]
MTDQRDVERQREELRRHLEEIEDRMNPAKVVDRTRRRFDEDPAPFLAVAGGVVAAIAGVVVLVVLRRR